MFVSELYISSLFVLFRFWLGHRIKTHVSLFSNKLEQLSVNCNEYFFFFSLNYILLSLHWRFKKIYKYNPYALAECFRMATCEPKSENQNISAYGVMLFVSGLYFIIIVNFFMFLN